MALLYVVLPASSGMIFPLHEADAYVGSSEQM